MKKTPLWKIATGLLGLVIVGLGIFAAATPSVLTPHFTPQTDIEAQSPQLATPETTVPKADNVHLVMIAQPKDLKKMTFPAAWDVQRIPYVGGLPDATWEQYPDTIILGEGVPNAYGQVLSEYYQSIPVIKSQPKTDSKMMPMPVSSGTDSYLVSILKHAIFDGELDRMAATSSFLAYRDTIRTWYNGTEVTDLAGDLPTNPTWYHYSHQVAGFRATDIPPLD
ncbi:exported hypothetical protein [Candidatus Desulfosporosinus infrequens]|uniref:Uncharacterized protein n=1 Tax=Candidatus Desulfosporosinus infrequens TaxID=2043169 RepID=A0A2U3LR56_9FIRM|nr:exported hypothetical protein [Candidatus Desulfosporosinus infrequens]